MVAWISSGCTSESTVATLGEAGLVVWSTTVFHRGEGPGSWDQAEFVVGTPYRVSALLTDDGSSAILEPHTIEQRLRVADGPDAGSVEALGEYTTSDIEVVRMRPEVVGTLYLEAVYQGNVVDVAPLEVMAGRVEVDDGVVYGVEDGRW
jgi:hypothetical protein